MQFAGHEPKERESGDVEALGRENQWPSQKGGNETGLSFGTSPRKGQPAPYLNA